MIRMDLQMPAVPTGAATLPMQRCKATGLLPDMPQRSEDRAMSKSTCTAQRGRGYAPGPWSHAESMAEKLIITLYTHTHQSKAPHHIKHPPPPVFSAFIRYISGTCLRSTTRMNMQNSAAEADLRGVLARKVATLLLFEARQNYIRVCNPE